MNENAESVESAENAAQRRCAVCELIVGMGCPGCRTGAVRRCTECQSWPTGRV
ncbi:hypothetical protein ABZ490_39120 [Streptomyces sp. NPDC005811]|uniref:hypothetical protein n=1 Tax=Streptomyces sp. NPDC005811 TaxID=3154565 RepID=UPI0033C48842